MIRLMGFGLLMLLATACAKEKDRAAQARGNTKEELARKSKAAGFKQLPRDLFIRAFKEEAELEIWARPRAGAAYRLFYTYRIAKQSGGPGPKRKEGDRQVPEGFYVIEGLNPKSSYHLSLRLNYPNASDLKRSDPRTPGSDIYIHGKAVSIGCLAMTDPIIEEIYSLVANGWPKQIDVHLFPFRMTPVRLAEARATHPQFASFWAELEPAYVSFEKSRKPPVITVKPDGAYVVSPAP
jgi:murein L,D-transpeptidase YafK